MSDLLASEINSLCIRSEELLNGKHKNSAQLQAELREMFRRTKQLLTEMMDHNEELRNNNRYLKRQRLELEQRFEDIRLGIKNRQLKAEQSFLNSQLKDLENKTRKYHRRYLEIERFNMALSNVHLASNQLHATLDFSAVINTTCEILRNLAAATVFALFIRHEPTGALALVGGEGIQDRFPDGVLPEPAGMVADALNERGSLFIDREVCGDPLAVVPLRHESRGVIGLITIYEIARHKGGLSELDKELCNMLACQTVTALNYSQLNSETTKKIKSMESFIKLVMPGKG